MRDEVFYRLKVSALLLLFLAPVVLLHWSQTLQTQLEQQATSIPPAPEFANLQFLDDDVN